MINIILLINPCIQIIFFKFNPLDVKIDNTTANQNEVIHFCAIIQDTLHRTSLYYFYIVNIVLISISSSILKCTKMLLNLNKSINLFFIKTQLNSLRKFFSFISFHLNHLYLKLDVILKPEIQLLMNQFFYNSLLYLMAIQNFP